MTSERPFRDLRADLSRYPRLAPLNQPAVWAIAVYRFGRFSRTAPRVVRPLVHGIYFCAYSIVRLMTGIDLPRRAEFGPGLLIHHFGGIIVNPNARIGRGFVMRQGVTIGSWLDGGDCPVIGDFVEVGAYAQLLGGIEIGSHARIGAMSLVNIDVPTGRLAVGIPARIVS